tara:strand:- start:346 stop:507 length:162 start_codon:yes stop_codon:yes gene_type:complete
MRGESHFQVGSFSAHPAFPSIWISRKARTEAITNRYPPVRKIAQIELNVIALY